MKTCSVEGCERPHSSKGLCSMHYRRVLFTGSVGPAEPLRTKPKQRTNDTCTLEGCDRPYYSKGYCQMHSRRLRQKGSPGQVERIWAPGRTCSVEGCERPHSGHNLCKLHLNRLRESGYIGPAGYANGYGLSDEERFWLYVDKQGQEECWEWTASRNDAGYGYFGLASSKASLAHRYSYTLHTGKPINGLHIHHHCRNRACVNPSHLEALTPEEHKALHSSEKEKVA